MPNTSATCPDNDRAIVGQRRHLPEHACYLRVERDTHTGDLWLRKWTELADGGFDEEDDCEVVWIDLEHDRKFYAAVDAVFHTTFAAEREAHEQRTLERENTE